MSRMLQALRRLEATRKSEAPPAVEEVETPVQAEAPADEVVAEATPFQLPEPILPQLDQLPEEEEFEPAFAAWSDVNDAYDAVEALTFAAFLEDSDANRADVAEPETPEALPTAEPVAEAAHDESTTDAGDAGPADDFPRVDVSGSSETSSPSSEAELDDDVLEETAAVEERVLQSLDTAIASTDELAQLADDQGEPISELISTIDDVELAEGDDDAHVELELIELTADDGTEAEAREESQTAELDELASESVDNFCEAPNRVTERPPAQETVDEFVEPPTEAAASESPGEEAQIDEPSGSTSNPETEEAGAEELARDEQVCNEPAYDEPEQSTKALIEAEAPSPELAAEFPLAEAREVEFSSTDALALDASAATEELPSADESGPLDEDERTARALDSSPLGDDPLLDDTLLEDADVGDQEIVQETDERSEASTERDQAEVSLEDDARLPAWPEPDAEMAGATEEMPAREPSVGEFTDEQDEPREASRVTQPLLPDDAASDEHAAAQIDAEQVKATQPLPHPDSQPTATTSSSQANEEDQGERARVTQVMSSREALLDENEPDAVAAIAESETPSTEEAAPAASTELVIDSSAEEFVDDRSAADVPPDEQSGEEPASTNDEDELQDAAFTEEDAATEADAPAIEDTSAAAVEEHDDELTDVSGTTEETTEEESPIAADDASPSAEIEEAPSEANDTEEEAAGEFSWDELFPSEESVEAIIDTDVPDADVELHDTLGDVPVEALVAQQSMVPTDTVVPDSEGEADKTETATEEPPVAPQAEADSRPEETAAATDEPAADAEEQPAKQFTPAEVAAIADLKKETLQQQYRDLAARVRSDLAQGQHACAALVAAEHQPHVSDAVLRTAMAACLDDEEANVLVIDADLSDKNLTAGMESLAELGLTEVLKGRVPWQQAVRATGTPGLCLLPAGRLAIPKWKEGDTRLSDLLKELTCQWDLVLVDAGSCEDTATTSVLRAARNVYLVIRLGETEHAAAEQAVELIRGTGAAIRGSVVTNA